MDNTQTHTQQMDSAIQFTKDYIVPLSRLILGWQETGVLGLGKDDRCMVHDLAGKLPPCGRRLSLAETLIKNECLEIVANTQKKSDTNVIDILTECQTLFNDFNISWRAKDLEERIIYMTKTFNVCDRIEAYKKEQSK
jgi:hypothetical protein